MRVSLPKNWQQAKDWKNLRPMLMEMANKLETAINTSNQIYVVESTTAQPEGLRRRDLFMRIQELEGADSLTVYWYDGKELQPLNFNSFGGLIQPEQIAHFDFLHLTDTPDSYSGAGGYTVKVRLDQSGLEFVDSSAGTGTVTSVDGSSDDPVALSVTGGPITSAGTLVFSLATDLKLFVQAATWPLGNILLLDIAATTVRMSELVVTQNISNANTVTGMFIAGNRADSSANINFRANKQIPPLDGTAFLFDVDDFIEPRPLKTIDTSGNFWSRGSWDSSNLGALDSPGNPPNANDMRSFWRDNSFWGRDAGGNEILVGPGTGGGGGFTYFTRDSTSATTSSLPDGSTENIDISLGKFSHLLTVETDVAAWVRMYTDTSARATDSSRLITSDPQPGVGVLAEFITTSGQLLLKVSPSASVDSLETPPLTTIPMAVTNRSGSTDTVTVTVAKIRIE